MRRFTLLIICACISFSLMGQDKPEAPKYGIKFSGFIKSDFFYDTRQVTHIRDRHFLFYPNPVDADDSDADINDNPSVNFLAIQSRLKGTVTGPEAFGAKATGVLEADFFGGGANIFRVRHAIIKLNWEKAELLFGQYWHPMFVTGCFPGTVSFNTGVPFQPFSRNPQVRFTYSLGSLKLIAAAMTQRDFAGIGGYASLSNSGMPDFHGQVQFINENIYTGAGAGYKTVKPFLTNAFEQATDATLGSFYSIAYLRINAKAITFKVEGVYGQNMADHLMFTGFAVHEIDIVSGDVTYTPMNQLNLWADIHTNGKKVQYGLFAGYLQNQGTSDEIVGDISTRFTNEQFLDNVMRVSPRIIFNSGKVRIAGEVEYTAAAYAKQLDEGGYDVDEFGKANETETVSNIRFLLGVYYFF